MTIEEKEHVLETMKMLKEIPDYLQPTQLQFLCRLDNNLGPKYEKVARILAEYGVPVEKIVPCIVDLNIFLLTEL